MRKQVQPASLEEKKGIQILQRSEEQIWWSKNIQLNTGGSQRRLTGRHEKEPDGPHAEDQIKHLGASSSQPENKAASLIKHEANQACLCVKKKHLQKNNTFIFTINEPEHQKRVEKPTDQTSAAAESPVSE